MIIIFTDIEVVKDNQKLRVLSILYFIDFCEMSSMVVYAVNFHFISIIIDSEYEEYYNIKQNEIK